MDDDNVTISRKFLNYLYLSGYMQGHHDTVEGGYVDVNSRDWYLYFTDEVDEILREEGEL